MPDFLLEIGCEEIPARMIHEQEGALGARVRRILLNEGLLRKPDVLTFSTPRRLTVLAEEINEKQPSARELVLGPSMKIAFRDGKPTPAAEAFAKKVGLAISELEKVINPKGEYLAASVVKKGRTASEVLAELLPKEIAALNWPKNMYWRA